MQVVRCELRVGDIPSLGHVQPAGKRALRFSPETIIVDRAWFAVGGEREPWHCLGHLLGTPLLELHVGLGKTVEVQRVQLGFRIEEQVPGDDLACVAALVGGFEVLVEVLPVPVAFPCEIDAGHRRVVEPQNGSRARCRAVAGRSVHIDVAGLQTPSGQLKGNPRSKHPRPDNYCVEVIGHFWCLPLALTSSNLRVRRRLLPSSAQISIATTAGSVRTGSRSGPSHKGCRS